MAERVLAGDAVPGNVVLDIDGCLSLGSDEIPGAGAALEALRGAGYRVILATNNSTKTPEAVADEVRDTIGVAVAPERIVTSALAAARMLTSHDAPVMPIGEAGLVSALVDRGLEVTDDPEVARSVVVGLDRAISYDRIRRASQAVLLGARFIGTNHDPTFPTTDVPVPGAGSIIAAVERAGGRDAEYAGKPHPPMQEAIEAVLGPGPTYMVGDRPDTDIATGKRAGWATVLVRTGVAPDPETLPQELRPDHVLATVAELPGLLGA